MDRQQRTKEMFENPVVGAVFQEMFSFWIMVVLVFNDEITWVEVFGGAKFSEGKMYRGTPDEFRDRFHYGSIDGYSVDFEEVHSMGTQFRNKLVANAEQAETAEAQGKKREQKSIENSRI